MLVKRQHKQVLSILVPVLVVLYLVSIIFTAGPEESGALKFNEDEVDKGSKDAGLQEALKGEGAGEDDLEIDVDNTYTIPDRGNYREIFSLTTRDRKFFSIFLGGDHGYNPNIIPHPTRHDMWIVVCQHEQSGEDIYESGQLVCSAGFLDGVLVCAEDPTIAPIAPSVDGKCLDDMAYFNFRKGPRDARMFYGPDVPYIAYGSQSQHTCLGIWIQDVRQLLDEFHLERGTLGQLFTSTTELQRPAPWHAIEKNFFVFWDSMGKAYAHHDIYPKRVFAQIDMDGSVGEDLAPLAAAQDAVCMAKYMPSVGPTHESIHQATNSLHVTLCKRADPGCMPNDNNTFIMHIFQHKSYYDFHGIYEPYVILFERYPPFAIHAILQRPLWIYGRDTLSVDTHSLQYEGKEEWIPEGHTEMFYVTSISWRTHGQKHHGYMDDVLIVAFGIEDTRPAAIDVLAGDILQDLAFCNE